LNKRRPRSAPPTLELIGSAWGSGPTRHSPRGGGTGHGRGDRV